MLANLPVDVAIGKMLIMGTLFNQIDAVMSLAAALSVQSPFTNNAYKDQDCVAARRNLDSDHGDPITLLNSYREWLEIKATNRDSSKKWCRKRGLEEQVTHWFFYNYEYPKKGHLLILLSRLARDS